MRSTWYRRVAFMLGCWAALGVVGCGALGPPLVAYDDNVEGEDACLDLWSLVHFGSGTILAEAIGDDSFMPTLGLVTAWELAEPKFWPGWNESELNQDCDIIVGMFGWLVHEAVEE